jgi:gamma-glutamyltranspeptidase/glutathione hydrolase
MKYLLVAGLMIFSIPGFSQRTEKPPLYAKHWMAITGKPLGAEAGAQIFQKGGNAVDAACAMLGAVCTMWDVLSWGGETQAIIYNPKTKKVISLDALGFAPGAATVSYYKSKGYYFPPEYGPLAAVTPGTAGGLCHLLAEYGTMSLKEVLAPAMQMAAGYAIDAQIANSMQANRKMISQWPYSKKVFLTHPGEKREAPYPGEIFVQKNLLATLTKMVEAEQDALKKGKSRKEAIYAAYDRFYKGDIAKEFVRGCQEQGGLITMEDLARWKPIEEEPLHVNYKGIEVYKLQQWSQGPTLLEGLNILENFNLKDMGYNSTRYIHMLYQTMNLTFADRDFYYGDPYFAEEPMKGLLNKAYAKERAKLIQYDHNDSTAAPGDPYPFEGKTNPYADQLRKRFGPSWPNEDSRSTLITPKSESRQSSTSSSDPKTDPSVNRQLSTVNGYPVNQQSFAISDKNESLYMDRLWRGTTSIETCDEEGWVVSVTPSGGWVPACIAGETGVGMSERMQSFVLDSTINPFNVLEPYKKPRVTLTPTLAMKDGKPYLSFGVQGGDTQDQNLLQFFLNVVEFGMTVQEATEAPNINTDQLWLSLGGDRLEDRQPRPGRILLNSSVSPWTRKELSGMGYKMTFADRTSGPINAIYLDWQHGSFWGGSSNYGEDYGIAW